MSDEIKCTRCFAPLLLSADDVARNRDSLVEMDCLWRCEQCGQWFVLGLNGDRPMVVRSVSEKELRKQKFLLALITCTLVTGAVLSIGASLSPDVHLAFRIGGAVFALTAIVAAIIVGGWVFASRARRKEDR